ncbi:MAG: hypothetical protein O3B01_10090 [Planctomycetota bacterium]|nr:hypothetical protein [Planctomycetota bacterium]MDA1138920.1 hypothetical protein [Planctomycetota bacterium]
MPTKSMGTVARTIPELQQLWSGRQNFLLADECVPFEYEPPPLEDIIDVLRKDDDSRIQCADNSVDAESFRLEFQKAPLEKAMDMPFRLSNFRLHLFYGRGQLLEGFNDGVFLPWVKFLARAGFTWYRSYPIVFISGRRLPGNYHMDVSHVIAWQIHGTKVFNGFADPQQRTPVESVIEPEFRKELRKPAGIAEEEVLSYSMGPGDVLWNQILTPHWVDTKDEIGASINLSHGGLRLNGQLSMNGAPLERHYEENPEQRF